MAKKKKLLVLKTERGESVSFEIISEKLVKCPETLCGAVLGRDEALRHWEKQHGTTEQFWPD